MKKLLLISLLLVFIISCKKKDHTTPTPTACFTSPASVEMEQFAQFTNCSTNANSYQWDFGDGASSTIEAPKHKYHAVGIYNVTLTATNGGNSNKKSITITVTDPATKFVGTYSAVRTVTYVSGAASLGNLNYTFIIEKDNYTYGGLTIKGILGGSTTYPTGWTTGTIQLGSGGLEPATSFIFSWDADGAYDETSHQWWNFSGQAHLNGNTLTISSLTFSDGTYDSGCSISITATK